MRELRKEPYQKVIREKSLLFYPTCQQCLKNCIKSHISQHFKKLEFGTKIQVFVRFKNKIWHENLNNERFSDIFQTLWCQSQSCVNLAKSAKSEKKEDKLCQATSRVWATTTSLLGNPLKDFGDFLIGYRSIFVGMFVFLLLTGEF